MVHFYQYRDDIANSRKRNLDRNFSTQLDVTCVKNAYLLFLIFSINITRSAGTPNPAYSISWMAKLGPYSTVTLPSCSRNFVLKLKMVITNHNLRGITCHLQINAGLRFLQGFCKCLQSLQSAFSSVSQNFHGFVGQIGNDTIPITVTIQIRTSTINDLTIHTLTTKGAITVAVIVAVCGLRVYDRRTLGIM